MTEERSSFWRERKLVLETIAGSTVHEAMAEAWSILTSDKSIGIVEFVFNDIVFTMKKKDSLLCRS